MRVEMYTTREYFSQQETPPNKPNKSRTGIGWGFLSMLAICVAEKNRADKKLRAFV